MMLSKEDYILASNSVLQKMVRNYVTYDGWPILWTTRMLARDFEVSMYRMRNIMKPLKDMGLIEYQKWFPPCMCGEYCECHTSLPVWGYRVNEVVYEFLLIVFEAAEYEANAMNELYKHQRRVNRWR